jgi:ribosomal protein S19
VYGLSLAKDARISGDIIDVMFEKRGEAISWYMAKKVYKEFVYKGEMPDGAETVIEEMAKKFRESGWELKPMLSTLFKSEHFFDLTFRGAAIKSPYEFMIGVMRKLDVPLYTEQAGSLSWYGVDTGQFLGNPTNVKGWEGYRTWLNTGTLPKRITMIIKDITIGKQIQGRYINPHNGHEFHPIAWTDDMVLSWSSQFSSFDSGTLEEFTVEASNYLTASELSDAQIATIINRTGMTRTYEWLSLSHQTRIPIIRTIAYEAMKLPEFQLA